jgi:integrase/recombinase XerD
MAVESLDPSVAAGFQEWAERQKLWAPTTISQYCQRVAAADRWMLENRDKPLEACSATELKAYFFATKATPHNRNNIRCALVAFWDYLHQLGSRRTNIARTLPRQQVALGIPKPFSPWEARALIQAASDYSPMFGCIIVVYRNTGLRLSEPLRLKWPQVLTQRTTLIQKGRRERPVYWNQACKGAFEEWRFHADPDSPWVFASPVNPHKPVGRDWIERKFRAFGRELGIDNCHIHRLRHTCGSDVLRHTGKITTAQKVLGHASVRTTQIYALVEDAEFEAALENLPTHS